MAEENEKGRAQIVERWQQIGRTRQVIAAVLVAAVIAFLVLMLQHRDRANYITLYSNLDPAQAAPVTEYLREQNVPYKLDDFGTTIRVPQEMADQLRIEMAGKGLPFAQGLGFELFDEERLGMTDFERQVKLQRALQEELRRTVTSLEAVTQARVHLALPEPQIFMRESSEPSAAIYVKLNPFVSLKEEQVRGIVFLVASSVEDLKPENITLVDSHGNILYDAVTTSDPFMAVADSTLKQLQVKRDFELELENRVQNVLERVFGPGKALALVTAELDFDSRETTVIVYDNPGVPRSTHIIEEQYEGEGPPMGEVGEANYPGYVGVVPGGDSSYERHEEIVNYEISESTERTIAAPGKVTRLHTSVVVDSGGGVSPEQVEQVSALISSAIGFDEERGDQISVEGMDFDTGFADEMEASMAALEQQQRQEELFRQAVLGGAALLTLILVVLILRRRRRLREERELFPAAEGPSLEELLAGAFDEEEIADLPPEKTPQGRLQTMAGKNPEVAASVLRTWLKED